MSECPECGENLREEDAVCPKCGHGPSVPGVDESSDPAQLLPAGGTPLLIGLVVGLVAGLVMGWFWGRSSASSAGTSKKGASVKKAAAPIAPKTLRLRERDWRQSSEKLCTGVFEVVTAPPSIKNLSFSVMDSKGKVIGQDKVSSSRAIKPHTVLELGFESGDCSNIKNWQVKVKD